MTLRNVDPTTTAIIPGTPLYDYPIEVYVHNGWVSGPFSSTNIVIPSSSNSVEHVLRINVRTQGSINPIKVRSLGLDLTVPTTGSGSAIPSNTNLPTDIVSNDVRIYYTGGNGSVFNGNSTNLLSQTTTIGMLTTPQDLQEGDNYFWVTYTIRNTATSANYVFAKLGGVGVLEIGRAHV